jgi:hypothetical protein
MKMKVLTSATSLLFLAVLLPVGIYAAEEQQTRPQGPPPEAFDVCKGKSVGDSVEVTTPDGTKIKAVCRDMQGQLAALPEGMETPPQQ